MIPYFLNYMIISAATIVKINGIALPGTKVERTPEAN